MHESHDPYGALKQPDYRRLLAGNILASLGAEMQAVAVGWEIYQRERAAWLLGLVGLVQFLPVLCLAIPAGSLADRWNRKHLLMVALTIMTAAAAGLATISHSSGPLWIVYLLLVLAGVGRAFSIPARWSLVPQVVPPHLLRNAVTWNSTGWQLATISGPALGGIVIATFEPAGAYVATALCQAVSMVLISTIRAHSFPLPVGRSDAPSDRALIHPWYAGVQFIWRTKLILATITLDLFAVLLGGATALLPIFAQDILEVGPVGLGWLRTAPSVGALIMALGLAHWPPQRRPGLALLGGVVGFGLATIAFGLSEIYVVSWSALALTGAFDNISVVVRGTLIQTMTPNSLRGRVAAVNAVFISSSNELGALESGLVAQFLGPVATVVLGGAGTLLVVVICVLRWPELAALK
jgi:MFS family permease